MRHFVKTSKSTLSLLKPFHTCTFSFSIDKDVVKKRIKVYETELLLLQKQGTTETHKVSQIIKDLTKHYILDGQIDNALTLNNEYFEIISKHYGKKHMQLVDVYAYSALINFFSGMYAQAHNDYAMIVDIKTSAQQVNVPVEGLEQDSAVLEFLQYFSQYFTGVAMTPEEKKNLHIDDTTRSIFEISQFYTPNTQTTIAKDFLLSKLAQIDLNSQVSIEVKLEFCKQFVILNRRLASIFEKTRDHKTAIKHYECALPIAREAYGTFSAVVGNIQADLGTNLLASGDHTGCERNAKSATIIFSKIPEDKLAENPEIELKIAQCCSDLSMVYAQINEGECQRLLNICVKIYDRLLGRTSGPYVMACYKLAQSYMHSKKQEEAYKTLEALKADFDKLPEKRRENFLPEWHHQMGRAQLLFGQYMLALANLEKSMNKFKQQGFTEQYFWVWFYIAYTRYEEKKRNECAKILDEIEAEMKRINFASTSIQEAINEVRSEFNAIKAKGMDPGTREYTLYEQIKQELNNEFFLGNLSRGKKYDNDIQMQSDFEQFLKRKIHEDERVRNAILYREMTDEEFEELCGYMKELDPNSSPEFFKELSDLRKSPRGQQDLLAELEEIREFKFYDANPDKWQAELKWNKLQEEIEEGRAENEKKSRLEKNDVVDILKKKTALLKKALENKDSKRDSKKKKK